MQVLKVASKKKILEVAKVEFLRHGFQRTSMRLIAAKSNIGLSNIYNYFEGKNEIFRALVASLLAEFDKIKAAHNNDETLTTEVYFSKDYHAASVKMWLVLYKNYKEQLFLLFHKSEGSILANFKQCTVDDVTEISMEYFKEMKARYPDLNVNISDFFVRISIDWWLSALEKLVTQEFSEEEVERFMEEYTEYSTAGWRALMKV